MDTRALLIVVMSRAEPPIRRVAALERLAASGDRSLLAPLGHCLLEIEPPLASHVRAALRALDATAHFTARALDARLAIADRLDALRVLGALRDLATLPALLRALEDAAPRVRELAAQALLAFRSELAQRALERHLFEDAEPGVRMAAAQALAQLDPAAALPVLRRALGAERDGFARVIIELSIHRAEHRARGADGDADAPPRRQARRLA
jgi:HEAT repeat protein